MPVRRTRTRATWSTAWQPVGAAPTSYEAVFLQGRAEFKRLDHDIETRTEIAVVPEDAAEVRLVTVTNHGSTPREIELTSRADRLSGPAAPEEAP